MSGEQLLDYGQSGWLAQAGQEDAMPPPSAAVEMQKSTAFGGKISDEARARAASIQAQPPAVSHGIDHKGRAYRRLSPDELRDVEREDERERLRAHLAALRTELQGVPMAASAVRLRNLKNAYRLTDPEYTPEFEPTEAEVQAEIDRVQRELELLG